MSISDMVDNLIEDYENDGMSDLDENPTEADLRNIERMERQMVVKMLKRKLAQCKKERNERAKSEYVKPSVEVKKTMPQNLFSNVGDYKAVAVETEHDLCNEYKHIVKTPLFATSYYQDGSNRITVFDSIEVMQAFVKDYEAEELTKDELRYKYCCGANRQLGTLHNNIVDILKRIDEGDERAIKRVKNLNKVRRG